MATTFVTLPPALILLVHLHVLNYQPTNKSAHDENLFNPASHGGGERTKTMEEVAFFLVSKIEGTIIRAKKALPTYPCAQPSDTLAFRNALAKYMESLKTSALHAGARSGPSTESCEVTAWWWKEVIVRKSVLEECSGERFMRLLLALSTHALVQCIQDRSLCPSENNIRSFTSSLISEQSDAYSTALSHFQRTRRSWEKAARRVSQQRAETAHLHRRLEDPVVPQSSKYTHLTTEKLLVLRDSRLTQLLEHTWTPETLHALLEAAGLQLSSLEIPATQPPLLTDEDTRSTEAPSVCASQPLHIAAAHHPKRLRNLSRPLSDPSEALSAAGDEHGRTIELMTDSLAAEVSLGETLQDALLQAQHAGDGFAERLRTSKPMHRRPAEGAAVSVDIHLTLWEPPSRNSTTIPPARVAEDPPPARRNVQERVNAIRASLHASLPPVPSKKTTKRNSPTRLPRAAVRTVRSGDKNNVVGAHNNAVSGPRKIERPSHSQRAQAELAEEARSRTRTDTRDRTISAGTAEVNKIADAVEGLSGSSDDEVCASGVRLVQTHRGKYQEHK